MKIKIQCEDIDVLKKAMLMMSKRKVKIQRVSEDEIVFERPFRREDERCLFDTLDYLHESDTGYNVILVGDF